MMNKLTGFLIASSVIVLFSQCTAGRKISQSSVNKTKGLKDYYKDYFVIGAAVTPRSLHGEDSALIVNQFNSLTAENAMKMGPIHPKENEYNWKDADSIVAFAKTHGLKMRGHNLCWHTQAPNWIFKNEKGDTVTKEVLLQRLKDHITQVAGRYKGSIYAWDVVNEAIDDNDSVFYRKTAWYKICGDEFIYKAFEYAHAADPDATLFYNDYNTENPKKREKIYQMVKKMKEAGVPIHGVGLQGHWSINNPSQEELERSIQMFSSLGLQVQVTELDVSVYAGRQGGQIGGTAQRDTSARFTPEMEQLQREKYKMAFEVFRKYKNKITGVTFWNVSDRFSWLDRRGRKNYPLLFDTNRQPKKAYWDVVNFKPEKSLPANSQVF
jgi:endo-1,4-beta-xylanase